MVIVDWNQEYVIYLVYYADFELIEIVNDEYNLKYIE
jgi:hypothetical protein